MYSMLSTQDHAKAFFGGIIGRRWDSVIEIGRSWIANCDRPPQNSTRTLSKRRPLMPICREMGTKLVQSPAQLWLFPPHGTFGAIDMISLRFGCRYVVRYAVHDIQMLVTGDGQLCRTPVGALEAVV